MNQMFRLVIKNFSLFLALRYLKPKRTYVSIITLISIIGVALGVGVLIVVIAVMTGFEKRLEDLILGFEPHLRVEQYGFNNTENTNSDESRWDNLMVKIKLLKKSNQLLRMLWGKFFFSLVVKHPVANQL